MPFAAALMLTQAVIAQSVEQEIAERIKKVGSVCVEGQECAARAETTTVVASAEGGGDVGATYNKTCATCHSAGVAGAPKFGSAEDWAPRIEKGKEALYQSAVNGVPPAMPAKGMCFNCSDEELKALVDYMVNAAQE